MEETAVSFNCGLCKRYFRDSIAFERHNASTQHLVRAGEFKYEQPSTLDEIEAAVKRLMSKRV